MVTLPAAWLLAVATASLADGDNPFKIAGVEDPRAVYRFLGALQEAVATDNADAVARLSRFPLDVTIGGTKTRFASAADLQRAHPRVFTPCLKRVVAAATPERLGLHPTR